MKLGHRIPRYSDVYNHFFRQCSKTRFTTSQWWKRSTRRMSISQRIRFTRHLIRIAETQLVGTRLDHDFLITKERMLTLTWINTNLRPLQNRIIKHIWRPSGPMCRKLCNEVLLIPTQAVGLREEFDVVK